MEYNVSSLGFEPYSEKASVDKTDYACVLRVTEEHKTHYVAYGDAGECVVTLRGTFRQNTPKTNWPKVGDWISVVDVAEGKAVLDSILPRTSVIKRRNAEGEEQVIAVNVDVVCAVQGLDGDYNVRRLERYRELVDGCGADIVFVMNKVDLCDDVDGIQKEIKEVTKDNPIIFTSSKTGVGIDELRTHISKGMTAVFLGSSGAGKSTLTNALLQVEHQETGSVREYDSKGRHTTTHRELFITPYGAIIIDTPGMRELGVLSKDMTSFDHIEDLTHQCKFTDCDHERSAYCAVLHALEVGDISQGEYVGFIKLRKEALFAESRRSPEAELERKQHLKQLHKGYRALQHKRRKDKGE